MDTVLKESGIIPLEPEDLKPFMRRKFKTPVRLVLLNISQEHKRFGEKCCYPYGGGG